MSSRSTSSRLRLTQGEELTSQGIRDYSVVISRVEGPIDRDIAARMFIDGVAVINKADAETKQEEEKTNQVIEATKKVIAEAKKEEAKLAQLKVLERTGGTVQDMLNYAAAKNMVSSSTEGEVTNHAMRAITAAVAAIAPFANDKFDSEDLVRMFESLVSVETAHLEYKKAAEEHAKAKEEHAKAKVQFEKMKYIQQFEAAGKEEQQTE